MAEQEATWHLVFEVVFYDADTEANSKPYPTKIPIWTRDENEALRKAKIIFWARSSQGYEETEWDITFNFSKNPKLVRNDGYERPLFETSTKPTPGQLQLTPWQEDSAIVFYVHSPE